MATGAKLSIMGLYKYDSGIFDDMELPEGLDKDVVTNEILLQCYDLELIYPSFNLMKVGIRNWSKIEKPIWTKLLNTENIDYNPLWNVDATIEESRDVNREKTGSSSETISSTTNSTDRAENTHSQAGYNSSALVITDKDVATGSNQTTGSGSNTGSTSENEEVGETVSTRRTGNIGVTSSQQLLREERDVAVFSTIKYIVESFKKRFCLLVY